MAHGLMNLTEAQRGAVLNDEGNTLLVACPGSGKTRALVAKLLRCVDQVRGSSRRLACITYTNPAVYEIERRLQEYGTSGDEGYCDISTIHSFCLNNILRFFHWRLPPYVSGFSVLPSDSERYSEIRREVCTAHNLGRKVEEQFELVNRRPDGRPIITGNDLPEAAMLEFWRRLEAEGAIDFPNMIYWAYRLMLEWPTIADALAARYAWVLVDEFQDTCALQVEILKLIARRGKSQFFLVGDPYQSIYGFAGARPDLFESFGKDLKARRDWELLENFRSSWPVIEHAERLLGRNPPMRASGDAAAFAEEPQWIHAPSAFEAITDYFLPQLDELRIPYGKAAILSPWWPPLLHLGRQLRDYGIPIIGPGARPYKRVHLFAMLAEQVCLYIEEPDPRVIARIERELFTLIGTATGCFDFSIYSFRGRRTVIRLVREGRRIREGCESGVEWLRAAAAAFAEVLCEEGFLTKSAGELLRQSVSDMEADMRARDLDVANLSVADIGLFASGDRNLHLLTMHRAKGREFEAVAIVDLHDGRVPYFGAKTQAEFDEAKRLLYVAITRAKRVLMYVTDSKDYRNRPSPYLVEDGLCLDPVDVT